MVGDRGQPHPIDAGLGDQDPFWQRDIGRQPGTCRRPPAVGDRDSAGPDGTIIGRGVPQVDGTHQPVSTSSPPQDLSRTRIDFLEQDQVRDQAAQQLALPLSCSTSPERHIPRRDPHD
jgi:hypothetical protein